MSFKRGVAMDIDEDAGTRLRQARAQGGAARLPKSVRFVGSPSGMCEFEVVTGNAAYREGERFYLPPREARRVYGVAESA